ncbi:MAG: DUF2158 domain-containing protein [Alphaproteobacteria bacterium]|nr:DUF2158 domain-containing protein [Alphaproteobacteria bacterium]
MRLRVGDAVQLKTGGPVMVINGWDCSGRIRCS